MFKTPWSATKMERLDGQIDSGLWPSGVGVGGCPAIYNERIVNASLLVTPVLIGNNFSADSTIAILLLLCATYNSLEHLNALIGIKSCYLALVACTG